MIPAPLSENEPQRLAALYQYNILDTLPEIEFDKLTQLAAYICGTPIALVTLVDANRQWFKSKVGITADETPRDVAFCAHAILQPNDLLIVEDALLDERFADNPFVLDAPNIRFYAGSPLVDPQGYPLGTICTVDLVPRKLSPEQQAALHILSQQVITQMELRRQLQQEARLRQELSEAHEQVLQAAEVKSAFLANVSHEIRTPMNAILGMTDLLLETSLTEEQQDYVSTINVSGNDLLNLINDLLDLSKLEASKMKLDLIDFNLISTIEETLDLLAPQAHTKGIDLAHLIHPDTPIALHGSDSRLKQVLINLLGNAIKFTHQGEVFLEVRVKAQTDTKAELLFEISDTGIGIPPEEQQKLFQSFVQVDASTTRKYGGTGLGLAICRQLVALMEGEIGVESDGVHGSKFWFTVPLQYALEPLPSPYPQDAHLLAGKRLLLVDAHATSCRAVREQLRQWGVTVDQVDSAAGALEALETNTSKQPYEMILIDQDISPLEQGSLYQQTRANAHWQSIPFVLLVASNQRSQVQQAMAFGFVAHLVKPIKTSCLLATLLQLQPQLEAPATLPEPEPQSQPQWSQLKILLAEDNLINQKVALRQLDMLGCQADIATNGTEVLQLLTENTYDLIFMDCQMPILDGFATTRAIRQQEDGPRHTIIVALTANALQEDQHKCLSAGMDDYLSKPLRKKQLQAKLEYWAAQITGVHPVKPESVS